MRSFLRLCCVVPVLLVLTAGVSHAQGTDDGALLEDAARYAADFGVDLDEAVRRLQLQTPIGELDRRLSEQESGTFAGLWIEHTPQYRVVVRFTDRHARDRIQAYVEGGPLEGLVDVRGAEATLVELEADRAAARFASDQVGVAADSSINVFENRAELHVLDAEELTLAVETAGMRLPSRVALVQKDALAADEADIYGGLPISTCTLGFSVKNSSGTKGVATAGHCGNSQYYSGTNLPYQDQRCGGSQDVQWHTTASYTPVNKILAGSSTRSITSTKGRSSQSVGEYVCKQGKTTGCTCGTIASKSYLPGSATCTTHNATFIWVDGGSTNLSEPGDSGGPWFSGNTAYGIHKCGSGNDSCYMPIDYISALGVSVITSADPLSVYITRQGTWNPPQVVTAHASGGTPPYSYAWYRKPVCSGGPILEQSVHGDDGVVQGRDLTCTEWHGPYYSSPPHQWTPYQGPNQNIRVTVTDSAGASKTAYSWAN